LMDKNRIHVFIILFIMLLIFLSNSVCLAEQEEVSVFLDGNALKTEVLPVLIDSRVFLPARDIVEVLGGRITWFPALKLLNINMSDREVSVVIDVPEAEVNGVKSHLDTPPRIIQNRVMIPLEVIRLLAEIEVSWDTNSRELKIIRQQPSVNSIRSYTHPDKTRVVIDMSEQTPYHVMTLSNPDRIVVDVDGSISQLDVEQKEVLIEDPLVSRVRTGQFDRDTVRVVMDLKGNYEYQVFDLSSPQRIVVDITVPQEQQVAVVPDIASQEIQEEVLKQSTGDNGKYIVVIDPGHGGKDPGAIGLSGLREKDVALDIALQLRKMLQSNGFTVYLTRDRDIDVPLGSRPLMALQREACVFVSIHVNSVLQKGSTTARGVETYVLNSRYIGASAKDVADRENKASQHHNYENNVLNQIIADLEESASIGFSLDFADTVQKKLVQHTGLDNRGVKQAPFIVLKGVNMAAVLVEVGFISNPNEEKLLNTSEFREKVAQSLTQSIQDYIKNMPETI
jgi:N-acetylmuramoyl-L-alanine amidase